MIQFSLSSTFSMHIIGHDMSADDTARLVTDVTSIIASHVDELDIISLLRRGNFRCRRIPCLKWSWAKQKREEGQDRQPTNWPTPSSGSFYCQRTIVVGENTVVVSRGWHRQWKDDFARARWLIPRRHHIWLHRNQIRNRTNESRRETEMRRASEDDFQSTQLFLSPPSPSHAKLNVERGFAIIWPKEEIVAHLNISSGLHWYWSSGGLKDDWIP